MCFGKGFDIVVSLQKIQVDGVYKNFEVYNIDGNNYFKLRDIAYVLNGTKAQFSVEYNEQVKCISIITNSKYVSVGGELTVGEDKSATAQNSSQTVIINGETCNIIAYNIGGNNFFKLRDLGIKLNFDVDYDSISKTVIIASNNETDNTSINNDISKLGKGDIVVLESDPYYKDKMIVIVYEGVTASSQNKGIIQLSEEEYTDLIKVKSGGTMFEVISINNSDDKIIIYGKEVNPFEIITSIRMNTEKNVNEIEYIEGVKVFDGNITSKFIDADLEKYIFTFNK